MMLPKSNSGSKNPTPSLKVVVTGDYPIDNKHLKGGVQSASAYLVKGLARLPNVDIHVLTIKPPVWNAPDQISRDGYTLHLIDRHPRYERLRNYRNFQASFNQELAKIHPDIIHAQDVTTYAYVSLRSGYPTVVTVHGIRREDGKYYGSWGRRMRNIFDSFVVEQYIIRHTQHLIAIGHYVKDYYARLLKPDVHSYCIPNAIDSIYFTAANIPACPTILFAGTVIPRKRVLDLVKSFAHVLREMPSSRLRIAGECNSEPDYVSSIHQWIDQAGIADKIDWLGQLQESEVVREFTNCSLVALPSSQETTPMVLAQAMAAGKPVVATAVGGVPEMVGEKGERGLLVKVGDVPGLADSCLRLLRDSQLSSHIGQAGNSFALQNYYVDLVVNRTVDVYKAILNRKAI
jgi:glycosyltransferase involved in cell wall biosynthesis